MDHETIKSILAKEGGPVEKILTRLNSPGGYIANKRIRAELIAGDGHYELDDLSIYEEKILNTLNHIEGLEDETNTSSKNNSDTGAPEE